MTLVVDTSVAVKWVVHEPQAEAAAQLLPRAMIAPDLFQAEVGSALTKRVRRGELLPGQARLGFQQVMSRVTLLPTAPLGSAALELSLRLRHSIYDCYFLALAQVSELNLVTADPVFAGKARGAEQFGYIYLLGEEVPHA